jgi:hypothetical protein
MESKSDLNIFVENLLVTRAKVVYTQLLDDAQVHYIESRLSKHKYQIIWLDRHRPILTVDDIFKSCDVGFRIYWDCNGNWNSLQDFVRDRYYVPTSGCLVYLNNLAQLKLNDVASYNEFIDVLRSAGEYWESQNIFFKALIGLEQ